MMCWTTRPTASQHTEQVIEQIASWRHDDQWHTVQNTAPRRKRSERFHHGRSGTQLAMQRHICPHLCTQSDHHAWWLKRCEAQALFMLRAFPKKLVILVIVVRISHLQPWRCATCHPSPTTPSTQATKQAARDSRCAPGLARGAYREPLDMVHCQMSNASCSLHSPTSRSGRGDSRR